MTSTIASNPSRYAFGHHPPGSRPAAPINTSIFQPRSSDKCTWVSEAAFFDIDDEIEELDITLEDLKKGYAIIASALEVAQIPYAAVGGLAFTLLGARPEYLTHDVDFQVHTTPLRLFDVLRNMEKVRLKTGLQADNFRIHCQVDNDSWIGADFIMTNNPVGSQTQDFNGFQLLQFTHLLQTKLKSYNAREAERDRSDMIFLVERHGHGINKALLDQDQVDFFLGSLSGSTLERARKVLLI